MIKEILNFNDLSINEFNHAVDYLETTDEYPIDLNTIQTAGLYRINFYTNGPTDYTNMINLQVHDLGNMISQMFWFEKTVFNRKYENDTWSAWVSIVINDVPISTGDMEKSVYDPSNKGIDITIQEYELTENVGIYTLTGSGKHGYFKSPFKVILTEASIDTGNYTVKNGLLSEIELEENIYYSFIIDEIDKTINFIAVSTQSPSPKEEKGLTSIWKNPDPSIEFIPQTIDLDLSIYDQIYVNIAWDTIHNSLIGQSLLIGINKDSTDTNAISTFGYIDTVFSRMITVNETGVEFFAGSTNNTVDNTKAIPYEILAVTPQGANERFKTTVWTNSNRTSEFSAQNININYEINDSEYIEVIFAGSITEEGQKTFITSDKISFEDSDLDEMIVTSDMVFGANSMRTRRFSINKSNRNIISFRDSTNQLGEVDNSQMIPYKINIYSTSMVALPVDPEVSSMKLLWSGAAKTGDVITVPESSKYDMFKIFTSGGSSILPTHATGTGIQGPFGSARDTLVYGAMNITFDTNDKDIWTIDKISYRSFNDTEIAYSGASTLHRIYGINTGAGGGTGTGDMLKSVYDTNDDGIVDRADYSTNAGTANYANSAGTATSAATALSASTASSATTADSALNSGKLGGQLPSYYAKQSDINLVASNLDAVNGVVVANKERLEYTHIRFVSHIITLPNAAGIIKVADLKTVQEMMDLPTSHDFRLIHVSISNGDADVNPAEFLASNMKADGLYTRYQNAFVGNARANLLLVAFKW